MGRKRAPQPLALADSHSQGSHSPHAAHGNGSNGPIDVSPGALTSSACDPQGPSPRSPRPGIGVAPSGEPSLQVVSTPTSSKSSRSPRSPFSRFNTSKKAQAEQTQAQVPSPIQYQSQSADTPHQHPSNQAQTQTHAKEYSQQDDYYNQHNQEPLPEYPTQFTSSYTRIPQSATTPTLRDGGGQYNYTVQQPTPDREEEKHSRSASRFFHFNKASRSAHQLHQHSTQNRSQAHTNNYGEAMSRGADYPVMTDRVSSKISKYSDQSSADHSNHRPAPSLPSTSDLSLNSGSVEHDTSGSSKKNKQKPFTLLSRTKSLKERDGTSPKRACPKESREVKMPEPERAHTFGGQQSLKTAPIQPEGHEPSFRHMKNNVRNHSADRFARDGQNKDGRSDKDHHSHNRSHPSSFRDNSGSAFLNGLKSSGTRAADMISKGLFGKGGRSGSTTDRETTMDDEHYQLKVINRPLIEQTRMTRISKKLEESRDKTEFWMPAFPWRAIDYLNYKGSDVEGLYRVPGSGPQIKKWQRRFDEEFDVDLFAQEDLYDINIIGSMLKAWLRELPDELFPKEAQERIARECSGAEDVPQLLIDELSNLSPYNYYLLFAITCHLSLLLAHSDKNKMDFRNLCICFQPCMKIDAFCFRFLICDWRQCWQGCKNEAKFIEEEYMLMDQPPPWVLGAGNRNRTQQNGNGTSSVCNEYHDDHTASSSDSNRQSAALNQEQQNNGRLRKKLLPSGQSNGSMASNQSTVSTSLTVDGDREPPRRSGDMRPLSPIKPLSPLGF